MGKARCAQANRRGLAKDQSWLEIFLTCSPRECARARGGGLGQGRACAQLQHAPLRSRSAPSHLRTSYPRARAFAVAKAKTRTVPSRLVRSGPLDNDGFRHWSEPLPLSRTVKSADSANTSECAKCNAGLTLARRAARGLNDFNGLGRWHSLCNSTSTGRTVRPGKRSQHANL